MAANLQGMFTQMNNAINQNPLAQGGVGQGILDRTQMHAANALGALPQAPDAEGNPVEADNPMKYMTPGAQEIASKQQLSGLDMDTEEGLMQAAQVYQQMGDMPTAMALLKRAEDKKLAAAAMQKEQMLRESLATKAKKLGLPDMADQIATGASDLKEDQKKLQELEIQQMVAKGGLPARRAVAKRAGINPEQFEDAGMGKMTDDQFQDFLSGIGADVKGYQMANGTSAMLETNKYGQVKDPATGKWASPGQMGLKPAPLVSKVHNVSNKMVEALALKGIDNFDELHKAANDSLLTIENIDRNLALLDEMPTGITAPVQMFYERFAAAIGDDPSMAAAGQVYAAEAASRVAKEIKAFGSGTGLSDKDREFTETMAAGSASATPEALRRILRIRRDVAARTIEQFENTKASVGEKIQDPAVMELYQLRPPSQAQTPAQATRRYNPATGTFK